MICSRPRSSASFTVASTRCTWSRTTVVDCCRFSAITCSLGRISVRVAPACSTVGSTFVFTSDASASMFAIVLRIARYMARRTPACKMTAMPVRSIKIGVSLSIECAQAQDYPALARRAIAAVLGILGRGRFGRCFMISLATRFIGSAELFLLLVDYIAASIGPLRRLVTGFTGATAYEFTAFLSPSTQYFPRFTARAGCIKHSNQSSQSHTRYEPHKTATVTIRHDLPPMNTYDRMVHPL